MEEHVEEFQGRFEILKAPREVRDKIYRLCVKGNKRPVLNLLVSNRQIYQEAFEAISKDSQYVRVTTNFLHLFAASKLKPIFFSNLTHAEEIHRPLSKKDAETTSDYVHRHHRSVQSFPYAVMHVEVHLPQGFTQVAPLDPYTCPVQNMTVGMPPSLLMPKHFKDKVAQSELHLVGVKGPCEFLLPKKDFGLLLYNVRMADGYFRFPFSVHARVDVKVFQPFGHEFARKSFPEFRQSVSPSSLSSLSVMGHTSRRYNRHKGRSADSLLPSSKICVDSRTVALTDQASPPMPLPVLRSACVNAVG